MNPIKVVHACPCFLAQNLNTQAEILETLKERANTVSNSEEIRKLIKPLEKELEKCKADYKEHVTKWKESYSIVMMEQTKKAALEPLQTSAWKQGDLKKLLEHKPKKAHKRTAVSSSDGALSSLSVKRNKEDSLED